MPLQSPGCPQDALGRAHALVLATPRPRTPQAASNAGAMQGQLGRLAGQRGHTQRTHLLQQLQPELALFCGGACSHGRLELRLLLQACEVALDALLRRRHPQGPPLASPRHFTDHLISLQPACHNSQVLPQLRCPPGPGAVLILVLWRRIRARRAALRPGLWRPLLDFLAVPEQQAAAARACWAAALRTQAVVSAAYAQAPHNPPQHCCEGATTMQAVDTAHPLGACARGMCAPFELRTSRRRWLYSSHNTPVLLHAAHRRMSTSFAACRTRAASPPGKCSRRARAASHARQDAGQQARCRVCSHARTHLRRGMCMRARPYLLRRRQC